MATQRLAQIHQANLDRYECILNQDLCSSPIDEVIPFWDYVILCCGDESQKIGLMSGVEAWKDQGFIPKRTQIRVAVDRRSRGGNGSAMLDALVMLEEIIGPEKIGRTRTMIMFTGGDSKRLPSWTLAGKVLAPFPHPQLPCIFVAKMGLYCGLPAMMPPGSCFINCGDDLEIFDADLCGFPSEEAERRNGRRTGAVCALGHPSNLDVALTHGIWQVKNGCVGQSALCEADRYVLKAPRSWIDAQRSVTETTIFDPSGKTIWTDSAFMISPLLRKRLTCFGRDLQVEGEEEIDAYRDFSQFAGLGPPPELNTQNNGIGDARQRFQQAAHDTPIFVNLLPESIFYHLGTTAEYIQHYTNDSSFMESLDGRYQLLSFVHPSCQVSKKACIMTSFLEEGSLVASNSVLEHVRVGKRANVGQGCLMSNVSLPESAVVPDNCIIFTYDVANGADMVMYCTAFFSTEDDLKATGKTTANLRFLNRNFEEAVQRMGISLADSQVPQTETSLWTQRLFGLFSTPQQSQAFACWQLKAVSGEAEDCILSPAGFVSMHEMSRQRGVCSFFDRQQQLEIAISLEMVSRLFAQKMSVDTYVGHCGLLKRLWHRALSAPAEDCKWDVIAGTLSTAKISSFAKDFVQRLLQSCLHSDNERSATRNNGRWTKLDSQSTRNQTAEELLLSEARNEREVLKSARALQTVARLLRNLTPTEHGRFREVEKLAETLCIEATMRIRSMVCGPYCVSENDLEAIQLADPPLLQYYLQSNVQTQPCNEDNGLPSCVVTLPARINLAGGWSDVTPYTMECGGSVLNFAITIGPPGAHPSKPILASAAALPDTENGGNNPEIILKSVDGDITHRITTIQELLDYTNPHAPLVLHRAVVAFLICPLLAHSNRRRSITYPSLSKIMDQCCSGTRRIEVVTTSVLPHGCGLGTSSIIGLALLRAVTGLLVYLRRKQTAKTVQECPLSLLWPSQSDIPSAAPLQQNVEYAAIFAIELMMTQYGGGWQDQIGSHGGINLIVSPPMCNPRWRLLHVELDKEHQELLNARLVLLFTKRTRKAVVVVGNVFLNWMLRLRTVPKTLDKMQKISFEMYHHFSRFGRMSREEIQLSDPFEDIGKLLLAHRQLAKELEELSTNDQIEDLFQKLSPFVCGGGSCIVGAGSGGFIVGFLRLGITRSDLPSELREDVWETRIHTSQ